MAQRPRDCGGRAVVPRAHNTPAGSDSGDSMLVPPSGSCSRPSRRWPRRMPHVFFIFLNFNLSRASRPPHRAPTPRVGRCQSCLLVIVSQCLLSSARSHAPVTRGRSKSGPGRRLLLAPVAMPDFFLDILLLQMASRNGLQRSSWAYGSWTMASSCFVVHSPTRVGL